MKHAPILAALLAHGLAAPAGAQGFDPLNPGAAAAPPAPTAAPAASKLTPIPIPSGLQEHPVRTPTPANAKVMAPGLPAPPGFVTLTDNMPGHRRFRPPLFPEAGWDSPLLPDGQKDYSRYLAIYWNNPYPIGPDPGFAGLKIPGYINPPPTARLARSRAKPEEEALMERRVQFIVREVLAFRSFVAPVGTSIESTLTIDGYGEQYGKVEAPVMRATLELKLHGIQPDTGRNDRMPDGTVQSYGFGPTFRLQINPANEICMGPLPMPSGVVRCHEENQIVLAAGGRSPLRTDPDWRPGDPKPFDEAIYADRLPAAAIRALAVEYVGEGFSPGEMKRGRLHPYDPEARAVGALYGIDWPDLLRRANAID